MVLGDGVGRGEMSCSVTAMIWDGAVSKKKDVYFESG